MIRTRLARATLLAAVAWLVGALTAVTVGVFALSSVGTGLVGQPADPLAHAGDSVPQEVTATASGSGAQPTSTATTADQNAPAGADQPLDSPGGTVVARCVPDGVYLAFWTPAQGYRVDDVVRGPAAVAHVGFESTTREIGMTIRCVDGVAQSTVSQELSTGH